PSALPLLRPLPASIDPSPPSLGAPEVPASAPEYPASEPILPELLPPASRVPHRAPHNAAATSASSTMKRERMHAPSTGTCACRYAKHRAAARTLEGAAGAEPCSLPDGRERLVVVRLLRDLRHQLTVDDLVVLVEDHHGAGGQSGERAVLEGDAGVVGEPLSAHARERPHVLAH